MSGEPVLVRRFFVCTGTKRLFRKRALLMMRGMFMIEFPVKESHT